MLWLLSSCFPPHLLLTLRLQSCASDDPVSYLADTSAVLALDSPSSCVGFLCLCRESECLSVAREGFRQERRPLWQQGRAAERPSSRVESGGSPCPGAVLGAPSPSPPLLLSLEQSLGTLSFPCQLKGDHPAAWVRVSEKRGGTFWNLLQGRSCGNMVPARNSTASWSAGVLCANPASLGSLG